MNLTPLLSSLLFAAVLAISCAAADKPSDTDLAIQGEYVGTVEKPDGAKKTLAMQVVALGDGKFHSVGYVGGLPGDGWNGETPAHTASSRTASRTIEFRDVKYHAVIDANGADVFTNDDNKKIARLDRVIRKSPTEGAKPPDGAVVLFDGSNDSLGNWKNGALVDGSLLKQGTETTREFGSFTMHIEFLLPFKLNAKPGSQNRGNSGVYIHNRYEVQVLDAFGLSYYHLPEGEWKAAFEKDFGFKPESDRKQWTGSLYQFAHPTVNASYPPLAWQTYDIDFTAAKFDAEGKKAANARITVKHNDVLIHDDLELPSGTGAGKGRGEVPAGPIVLQEHGNPVAYRNIWIVPKDH